MCLTSRRPCSLQGWLCARLCAGLGPFQLAPVLDNKTNTIKSEIVDFRDQLMPHQPQHLPEEAGRVGSVRRLSSMTLARSHSCSPSRVSLPWVPFRRATSYVVRNVRGAPRGNLLSSKLVSCRLCQRDASPKQVLGLSATRKGASSIGYPQRC